MRRTLSAAALILTFCCTVPAGVIHNPPPEPPPPVQEVVLETEDGETNGAQTDSPGWSDSLTQITLDLLTILPTLF